LLRYTQYHEYSKKQLSKSETALARIEGELSAIQPINDPQYSEERLKELKNITLDQKKEVELLAGELGDILAKKTTLNDRLIKEQADTKNNRQANNDLTERTSAIQNKIVSVKSYYETLLSSNEAKRASIKKSIETYDKLLANKETIELNLGRLDWCKTELAKLDAGVNWAKDAYSAAQEYAEVERQKLILDRESISKATKDAEDIQRKAREDYAWNLDELVPARKEIEANEKKISDHEYNLRSYRNKLKKIEEASRLVSSVPCDAALGATCKFVSTAHAAIQSKADVEKEIFETEKVIEQLRQLNITKQEEIATKEDALKAELNSNMITYDTAIRTIEAQRQELNRRESDIAKTLETVSMKRDEIIASLKPQREEAETIQSVLQANDWTKLKERAADAENQKKIQEHSLSSLEASEADAKMRFEADTKELTNELTELEKKFIQIDETRIPGLEAEIRRETELFKTKDEKYKKLQSDINDREYAIVTVETKIETERTNAKKRETLEAEKTGVQMDIREWAALCKAFSPTGIPVLKLENSGIDVTLYANELLSLFENKFRIAFDTTRLDVDKKNLKETFDINIIEPDGICEISNKSGGEKVWLETAIQLAISLLGRRQGKSIQTAYLDEKDGALSLENSMAYFEMVKKAHEMSHVYHTLVITHTPEIIDAIQQQVIFSDGYLTYKN
jgi:chromosome segregation ATPase